MILADPTLAALTVPAAAQELLYSVVAFTLVIGLVLRKRASRAVNSVKGRSLVQKSKGADTGLTHTHTVLEWIALLCFAVAGIAASGTIINTAVLWAAHTVNDLTHHVPLPILIALNVVVIIVLWKSLHLFFDVIEGKAHHGSVDWWVFLGPMLFPLIGGPFGQFWTWVYTEVGLNTMHYATEIAGGAR